jgi:hypothetical protein
MGAPVGCPGWLACPRHVRLGDNLGNAGCLLAARRHRVGRDSSRARNLSAFQLDAAGQLNRRSVLGINRRLHVPCQRPLQRAGQRGPVGAIDQDRLTDQRQILCAGAVFVGLTDAFRKRRGNAAGKERCDVQLLPRFEVGPDHDCDLAIELHD